MLLFVNGFKYTQFSQLLMEHPYIYHAFVPVFFFFSRVEYLRSMII